MAELRKNSTSGFVMVVVMVALMIIAALGVGLRARSRSFLVEVARGQRDTETYWAVQGAAEYVSSREGGGVTNLGNWATHTINGVDCSINVALLGTWDTGASTLVTVSAKNDTKRYTLSQTNTYVNAAGWDLSGLSLMGQTNLFNEGGFSDFLKRLDSWLGWGIPFEKAGEVSLAILDPAGSEKTTTFTGDGGNKSNVIEVNNGVYGPGTIVMEDGASFLVSGANSNFNGTVTEADSGSLSDSSQEVAVVQERTDEFDALDASDYADLPITESGWWIFKKKTAELAGNTYRLSTGDYSTSGTLSIVGPGTVIVPGDLTIGLGAVNLSEGAELVVQGEFTTILGAWNVDSSTVYAEAGAVVYGIGSTKDAEVLSGENFHMSFGSLNGFVYAPMGASFLGLDFEGVLLANQLAMFEGGSFKLNEALLPYYLEQMGSTGSGAGAGYSLLKRTGWNLQVTGVDD